MVSVVVMSYSDSDVEIQIGLSASDASVCCLTIVDYNVAGDKFVLFTCLEDDTSGLAV